MIKRIPYSQLENDWSLSHYLFDLKKPCYEVKKLQKICQINPIDKRVEQIDLNTLTQVIEISSTDEKGRIIKPRIVSSDEGRRKLFSKINYKADKGDILVPLIQVKNFVPVIVDKENMLISSNYAILESKVSAYYLYWALSKDYVKKQIQLMARGSVIDRITLKDLREVEIPWLEEKDRLKKEEEIKHMLEVKSFEELNLLNKAKINAIFEDKFGYSAEDLEKNDVCGIDEDKLSDSENLDSDYFLRKDLKENISYQSDEVEVLSLKDVVDYIGLGLNKYRVKEGPREVSLIQSRDLGVMQCKNDLESIKINEAKIKEVMEGDVLMKRKGGVGPAAVFKNEQLSTFDDSTVRLVGDEKIVKPAYLAMYLNSNLADYLFEEYLVEKSTTYIKVSDLKKVEILVPNIDIQEELIAEFERR